MRRSFSENLIYSKTAVLQNGRKMGWVWVSTEYLRMNTRVLSLSLYVESENVLPLSDKLLGMKSKGTDKGNNNHLKGTI